MKVAMPAQEIAYAMTVYKDHGSEFDSVWLLLPVEGDPVFLQELVYTGITRARSRVTVLGPAAVLRLSVKRLIQRDSGLLDGWIAADLRLAQDAAVPAGMSIRRGGAATSDPRIG